MRALPILGLLASTMLPMRASAQCVLTGHATIERVRIALRGAEAFDLGLDGYEVTIVPLGDGRVRVESATSLVWSGTARDRDVGVYLARPLRLAGGAVSLLQVPMSGLTMDRQGDPSVDVELAEGVWIRGARVPCDAIALTHVELSRMRAPGSSSRAERGDVLTLERSLDVHERPGGPSVRIELSSEASLRFARMESRGEWIRVHRELASGAEIDGWVRASQVGIVAEEPFTYGEGALGLNGRGLCGRGASHTYVGPATLLAGTEIRTAEGGAVWAIASADVEVRVMVGWGAEWGLIDSIDGLLSRDGECENLFDNAWVPSSALRLPSGAPLP